MECPHCKAPVFRASSDAQKMKARTSMVVLHKSGEVELNCGACGKGVVVPLALKEGPFILKKAEAPKFVFRRS